MQSGSESLTEGNGGTYSILPSKLEKPKKTHFQLYQKGHKIENFAQKG